MIFSDKQSFGCNRLYVIRALLGIIITIIKYVEIHILYSAVLSNESSTVNTNIHYVWRYHSKKISRFMWSHVMIELIWFMETIPSGTHSIPLSIYIEYFRLIFCHLVIVFHI